MIEKTLILTRDAKEQPSDGCEKTLAMKVHHVLRLGQEQAVQFRGQRHISISQPLDGGVCTHILYISGPRTASTLVKCDEV